MTWMPKKSRWDSDFWKAVKALSVVLTIIVSILTILQFGVQVNVYTLIANFFTIPIPLYSVPLTLIVILIVLLALGQIGYEGNILDHDYSRELAIECDTPRTTDYLHRKFDGWHNRDYLSGGRSFKECMKLLENQGYLKYRNEQWEVTQKALDYIDKYHGG